MSLLFDSNNIDDVSNGERLCVCCSNSNLHNRLLYICENDTQYAKSLRNPTGSELCKIINLQSKINNTQHPSSPKNC